MRGTHYVIMGSLGATAKAMRPIFIALDTCSGYNIIRRSALPSGWERLTIAEERLPALCDANGNPIKLDGAVQLRLRLANQVYSVTFIIAAQLSVDVILGTAFQNKHVRAIQCMARRVQLNSGTIPILTPDEQTPEFLAENSERSGEASLCSSADRVRKSAPPYRIRLAKAVTLPGFSQCAVRVSSDARGLCLIEPKHGVFVKYQVRASNGVFEAHPDRPTTLVVSNFGETPRKLPKGMVIAYATRSPVAIVSLDGPGARQLANCLHISEGRPAPPPETDTAAAVPLADQPVTTVTAEPITKPTPEPLPHPQKADWRGTVDLTEVDDHDLKPKIMAMLEKHSSMWDGQLGCIRATDHRIELRPGTRPIRQQPYRTGFAKRDVIATHIGEMLQAGVIEPTHSEWASPVVLAPKKDGTLRFCIDYRRLNAATIPDAYPLPPMDDCLDSLAAAKVFTTLDAFWGYWQIPIAIEDRDKTTFTTHMGTFRHTRMPFGLRNAPATFQRALDIVLSGVRWQTCLVYLDDVVVFSRSYEEHVDHVDHIPSLLAEAGVKLKLKKCFFL